MQVNSFWSKRYITSERYNLFCLKYFVYDELLCVKSHKALGRYNLIVEKRFVISRICNVEDISQHMRYLSLLCLTLFNTSTYFREL